VALNRGSSFGMAARLSGGGRAAIAVEADPIRPKDWPEIRRLASTGENRPLGRLVEKREFKRSVA